MDSKSIINDPEPSGQQEHEKNHRDDGLRILARLIARNLVAKRSTHLDKNVNTDSHDIEI